VESDDDILLKLGVLVAGLVIWIGEVDCGLEGSKSMFNELAAGFLIGRLKLKNELNNDFMEDHILFYLWIWLLWFF